MDPCPHTRTILIGENHSIECAMYWCGDCGAYGQRPWKTIASGWKMRDISWTLPEGRKNVESPQ